MQIEILTPSHVLFKGEVDEVVAPAVTGEVDILPLHADYVTSLGAGRVQAKVKGQPAHTADITGGLLSVTNNKVMILADGIVQNLHQ